MLDEKTRNIILTLAKKKVTMRRIAKELKISRSSVKKVILSQNSQPPTIPRPEKAEPYRDEILELYASCRGNLVRVHEELTDQGAELSYQTLTAFCRRHRIGTKPKQPVGRYSFEPGQEMQHDTSPHKAEIGGKRRSFQTASAVLCYSRMTFFQCYPRFRRFECKIFLTEALRYFQGSPRGTMVDNTNVVRLRGTGKDMIPTAEMEAFAEHYGMVFNAHAVGDANRSARVERRFHEIENNFLVGRTFADWDDLNAQARTWCDRNNRALKRYLKAAPIELYNIERAQLRPLPVWIPEPYQLHQRIVDVHGYVSIDSNRYSTPADWIGRTVQAQETYREIVITRGRESVTHVRHPEPEGKWITLPEHRPERRRKKGSDPPKELAVLLRRAPELESYVKALKEHAKRSFGFALRQILRMLADYPRKPLLDAVRDAERYGLYDIDRLETMVLQRIDRDFFPLDKFGEHDD
jgi:transposase